MKNKNLHDPKSPFLKNQLKISFKFIITEQVKSTVIA